MIRLAGVNKVHEPGGFQSLHDVTLEIGRGQLVVLNGVSGSGKSTLLSIIGALRRPTSGEVEVDGRRIAKLPDRHASAFRSQTVGFVFQNFGLLEDFTVAENVGLPLVPRGCGAAEMGRRVAAALDQARIAHRAHQRVRDLSGGEMQRTAIARALVGDAPLLLCDEPTANLDSASTEAFVQTLATLKDLGKTILVATHDPRLAEPACVDRVVEIAAGRIGRP